MTLLEQIPGVRAGEEYPPCPSGPIPRFAARDPLFLRYPLKKKILIMAVIQHKAPLLKNGFQDISLSSARKTRVYDEGEYSEYAGNSGGISRKQGR